MISDDEEMPCDDYRDVDVMRTMKKRFANEYVLCESLFIGQIGPVPSKLRDALVQVCILGLSILKSQGQPAIDSHIQKIGKLLILRYLSLLKLLFVE